MNKTTAIFISIVLFSCKNPKSYKENPLISDKYIPTYTQQEILNKLNKGYKIYEEKNTIDSFQKTFDEWNKNIKPNSKDFIYQNDTIKAVYSIYNAVYKPFNLSILGKLEVRNDFNFNSIYTVVQNKIYYSVVESDSFSNYYQFFSKEDSISNFRPLIGTRKTKILYLVPEYKLALEKFLNEEISEKKYKIIRNLIPIFHAPSLNYWNLETQPQIDKIYFNRSLSKSIVSFRVRYEGGEAQLIKTVNGWKIIQSKITRIQ